ncbi:carbohydrate ABC transporter permease [Spirulina subsalsa]|uniref:carbohydrate ABC transporter permease n=1 Tax=Spirulina subsalsa TaxID=54311 RepID=UPI0003167C62|nr:sugar ABC transporter permease [Spirulina subsalsa]
MNDTPSKFRLSWVPYAFLLPALGILTLTVFFPAFQAFSLSFARYERMLNDPPTWIGLANFERLLADPVFWQTLRNTLLYLIGVVPILVFLPLFLAVLVNQKLRGIHWFRMYFFTPVVISMVVAGIAWNALYDSNGVFNQILRALGWESGILWLTDPHSNLPLYSVMVVTIWKGLGYYMVIYLAGLQGIPAELYEAAAIDGSVGWRKHWDITLPLMRPYLVLVAVISAISATKVFDEVYVMTQGGPGNRSKTVVFYMYEQAFRHFEITYACTIGLVLFLLIFGLALLNLYLSNRQKNYANLRF